MDKIKEAAIKLAEQAVSEIDARDAMMRSQAALNLAHAYATLWGATGQPEQK